MNFQCSCCGKQIPVAQDGQIVKCPVCGNLFVVPNQFANKQNIYHLAAEALANRSFDIALTYYSRILKVDAKETAAHWGYLLSKFGVEISEAAETYQNIIFHRMETDLFTSDPSYGKMIAYCPREARYYYEGLSREIEARQRKMLEISRRMGAFDIYINCVEQPGTADYLLANQVGKVLHDAGYRVFLPCTMLAQQPEADKNLYEMAIAEKSSAMIVIATSATRTEQPRYRAVWKRFLAYRRQDAGRKMLSVFRGMTPEQLPLELQPLQSIPYEGAGFDDTVLAKINEMFGRTHQSVSLTKEILELLRKAEQLMQQRQFEQATAIYADVLTRNAEEAEAHWGLVRAQTKELTEPVISEELDQNYQHALQFSQESRREQYRAAMSRLMREKVWDWLSKLTSNLTNHSVAYVESVEAAIQSVYLYLPKEDPRLREIDRYRAAYQAVRQTKSLKEAYERRDTATEPLFTEQSVAESEYNLAIEDFDFSMYDLKRASWLSFFGMLLLLVAQMTLVRSYVQSHDYEGLLYQLAKWMFIGGVALTAFNLFTTLKSFEQNLLGVLLGGGLCVGVYIVYGKHTQKVFLIAIAVAAVLWLVLRFLAMASVSRNAGKVRVCNKAAEHVYDVNQRIAQNYEERARSIAAKYGRKDLKIPALTVRNSEGFSYTRNLKSPGSGFLHLIFTAVMAAALVIGVTFVTNNTYAAGWKKIAFVAPGDYHVVGIRENGTAVANGLNDNGQCNVSDWEDIVAADCGTSFSAGLREDGTVAFAGPESMEAEVESWEGIVQISASRLHLVGLCEDGTVVAASEYTNPACDVSGFRDVKLIRAIDHATGSGTLVVLDDGAMRATQIEGWEGIHPWLESYSGSRVGGWQVKEICGNYGALAMICEDGAIHCTGTNGNNQLSGIDEWDHSDLVQIYVGEYSVGLRHDGTTVFAGMNSSVATQTGFWEDVVDLQGSDNHLLALREDGTVYATGQNGKGQCGVSAWSNIESIHAGAYTSFGVREDGKVEAAGYGYGGMNYLQPRDFLGVIALWTETFSW